jgi:signal peptidase I
MFGTKKVYSLRKSRSILRENYNLYKHKAKKLTPSQKGSLEKNLFDLEQAITQKNRELADSLAHQLQETSKHLLPKTGFDYAIEILSALVFALIVAGLVRTMWFELYKIPTGSMRPTFQEQDHLVVSKTNFGINVPFQAKHFYFDPSLIERTGIVIFSIDNMDVANPDTTYFYLFPGKKLLVKRLIGKPGDTLYFYGGNIYGIDKDGNDLKVFREAPWLKKIDHVPYISFDGKVKYVAPSRVEKQRNFGEYYFYQMNLPVAKLAIKSQNEAKGAVFNGETWVPDQPETARHPHSSITTYSDIWGMGNYAMARILNKQQLQEYARSPSSNVEDGLLYLELFHSPNLTNPYPRLAKDERGQILPLLTPMTTVIPLQQKHLDALMDNLYTARFVVSKGYASRYDGLGSNSHYERGIPMGGVPDGTYEFYYGKGYRVNSLGVTSPLPKDHPLYRRDLNTIQTLFNLGIEFNSYFIPSSELPLVYASRYSYFRDGDLYLMGGPVFKKDDPILLSFLAKERKRQASSTPLNPYIAFEDHGAPLKNGAIDREFIKAFGVKVPEKMYLVLGDNYAMSGDSREFGFVPENNIRGGPWLTLWPPGNRWLRPLQPEYPWFVTPQLIVWGCALVIIGLFLLWYYLRSRKPIFKPISTDQK